MASTYHDGFERDRSRSVIDLPVAALAALSVGFVAFAMPADLLSQAVAATGLPTLLPAAAPPLGATARALVVGVAASATFAAIFMLLRLLDRRDHEVAPAAFEQAPPRPRVREFVAEPEEQAEPPRLRRADSHPDAPARRPILAGSELGEPDLARPYPQRRALVAEPEPEPEVVETSWEPVEAFVKPEPEPEVAEAPAPEPEPVHETVSAPIEDSSISDLVARLERGLGRRQPVAAAEPAPLAQPEPAPAEPDDRLRSAIENLQRLAARGG
jgi:hypothetical protein